MYISRLCIRAQAKGETERERLLLAYQVNEEVHQGHFPVSKELALEVAALMAQVFLNRKYFVHGCLFIFKGCMFIFFRYEKSVLQLHVCDAGGTWRLGPSTSVSWWLSTA